MSFVEQKSEINCKYVSNNNGYYLCVIIKY